MNDTIHSTLCSAEFITLQYVVSIFLFFVVLCFFLFLLFFVMKICIAIAVLQVQFLCVKMTLLLLNGSRGMAIIICHIFPYIYYSCDKSNLNSWRHLYFVGFYLFYRWIIMASFLYSPIHEIVLCWDISIKINLIYMTWMMLDYIKIFFNPTDY